MSSCDVLERAQGHGTEVSIRFSIFRHGFSPIGHERILKREDIILTGVFLASLQEARELLFLITPSFEGRESIGNPISGIL